MDWKSLLLIAVWLWSVSSTQNLEKLVLHWKVDGRKRSPNPAPRQDMPHKNPLKASGIPSVVPPADQSPTTAKRPNILIFMADDLGHADLGYSGATAQVQTPHIDGFAWDGIILNRHYSDPLCTPTRSSFMTGKYAFQVGMQSGAISEGEPWGLPLVFKIQPQYFQELGYSTYAVGKWHLGSHTRSHFPGARGFDYSYGITSGDCNWYDHTAGWMKPVKVSGRALRENGRSVPLNTSNHVSFPEMVTTKAEELIASADSSKPWYLYFATPLTHTGFANFASFQHDIGKTDEDIFAPSSSSEREKQLAAIRELDDTFKRLVEGLRRKGVLDNTIIVFLADNGAPLPESGDFVHGSNAGSNWPLRQGKGTLFDGGVRTLSFIWAHNMRRRGYMTDQLVHVSDWLPTLHEAAGGNAEDLKNITGHSHWMSFLKGSGIGSRSEIVNNIDGLTNQYAMVQENPVGGLFKIIGGNIFNNSFLGWRRPDMIAENETTAWTPASVRCNNPQGIELAICQPWIKDCLFELRADPCETSNIANLYPTLLRKLQKKLLVYNSTSYPPQIKPYDPLSNPDLHDGLWVPWKDQIAIIDSIAITA